MTAAGNMECKSSYFVEIDVLVREINSVGKGKLRELLGDFYGILLGNPKSLATSLGNFIFGAVIIDFCFVGDIRIPDLIKLYAENMVVIL